MFQQISVLQKTNPTLSFSNEFKNVHHWTKLNPWRYLSDWRGLLKSLSVFLLAHYLAKHPNVCTQETAVSKSRLKTGPSTIWVNLTQFVVGFFFLYKTTPFLKCCATKKYQTHPSGSRCLSGPELFGFFWPNNCCWCCMGRKKGSKC